MENSEVESILVVDDEKSIRLTLTEFLKREGYRTLSAENVETALEYINKESFDIIISDILMPKKSGIDLLEIILSKSPQTKVIMITGEPNVETASQAIRLGACDYLNKPVDKNSVLKSVANALRLKNLEDENRNYQSNLERLVEKRTLELETALKEKEEMQQQIIRQERLKGLCLISSGIAHNINNTISPIFMYSEALLEKNAYLNNESRQYIDKIITAAEEIEAIVLKMEDLYNIQNDFCHNNTSIDTSKLILTIAEYFNQSIKDNNTEKEININAEVDQNLPPAAFEKNSIEEVLKAVIKNSIEAVRSKGKISIKNYFDGDFISIVIEDDGIGMNNEQKEHCCDPFFTSKGPQSSGLGLTSVYGAIHRNKGRMKINSEYGEGTEIILSLPVYQKNNNLKEKENA